MYVEKWIFLLLFLAYAYSHSHEHGTSEYSMRMRPNVTMSSNNSHQQQKQQYHHQDELVVDTENGRVRGRTIVLNEHFKEINGSNATAMRQARKVYRLNAWLGIPYAEKPLGELRFKRPVPIKSWHPDTVNATHLPNSCYQLPDTVINNFTGVEMWNANTQVSEDCLYLNIWSISPKPRNSPVLVWIYGGGFYSGTSTLKIYDPRVIVAETELIFVSLQYRLSIFGFLYMNHEGAPGNQGLLDQHLALKWIHNNIQYFGGDSSKITIFGESAGSVSVSLHLLSPLSANLFNNAIMESGTALADWAILEGVEATKRNSEILSSLGCNQTRVDDMIECVKKVDAHTAVEKSDEHFYTKANQGVAQFTFLPVVDNYFLEDEPINLLNRGKFKKCPVLLGANKDEGNWLFVYAFPEYRNLSGGPIIDYETFKDFLTSLFYFYPQYPSTSSSSILKSVIYRYTHWPNVHNTAKNLENLDDAAGDFHFVCPMIDFANIYALNKQDVYFYYYTQRSSRHQWPEWLGVMHGDEISFVFGEPLYTEFNFTWGEKVLARKILKYWSNFVRFSDPNGQSSSAWPSAHSSYSLDDFGRSRESGRTGYVGMPRYNDLEKYPVATQTMMQPIELWPKYRIMSSLTTDDYQRAYIVLNSHDVHIDYNLRAEYCAFWGSYIPSLVLSESRCSCISCLNTERLTVSSSKNGSSNSNSSSYLVVNWSTVVLLILLQFLHLKLI